MLISYIPKYLGGLIDEKGTKLPIRISKSCVIICNIIRASPWACLTISSPHLSEGQSTVLTVLAVHLRITGPGSA